MIRVLYIDDDADLLATGKELAERSGLMWIDGVTSVTAAARKISEERYDAVVCEYQVSGTDCLTILREMRKSIADIPFIIFTKRGREEMVAEALNNGADLYIHKGGSATSAFAELQDKVLQTVARKRAERRILESEARLRAVTESSSDVIWEVDLEGRFTYISATCELVLGRRADELRGSLFSDLMVPDEKETVWSMLSAAFQRGDRVSNLCFLMSKGDGTLIEVETSTGPLSDAEGRMIGHAGLTRDVTPTRQELRRHLATERSLRNANARLSLLSSITRHDTMNQVQVMKGYLELAESMAQDERRRANLARIREAAEQIQKQLEFTKQYERMGLDEPAWIPLAEMGEKLRQEATKKGVACALGDLEYGIYADNMFDKVFFNFLDNSLRHGKQVRNVRLEAFVEGEDLKIVYQDDGIGVAEKDKPKLFQRGYGSNTGMGLFLAREILSITDLAISENGIPGKGVRFCILVPRERYRPTMRG
jgi:PAS domain S-box-containing protein